MECKWRIGKPMFGGTFTHRLDEVGRFIMPRKFRLSLGESFIVTRGIGCLLVMTGDRFNDIYQQIRGAGDVMSVHFDPQLRRLYHHLFSEMIETKGDVQGRVQLTNELREHAGIEKDMVIIGVGDWVEIWSAENWKSYKETSLTPELLVQSSAECSVRSAERCDGECGTPGEE